MKAEGSHPCNAASLNLVFAGTFVGLAIHERSLLHVLLVLPVHPIHESSLGQWVHEPQFIHTETSDPLDKFYTNQESPRHLV